MDSFISQLVDHGLLSSPPPFFFFSPFLIFPNTEIAFSLGLGMAFVWTFGLSLHSSENTGGDGFTASLETSVSPPAEPCLGCCGLYLFVTC